MTTFKTYIRENGIKTEATMVGENPNMPDNHDARHYKVVLRNRARRQMTLYFSMGLLLECEPEPLDVLICLASDALSVECTGGFEGWASDFGHDTDSRKAERMYAACQKITGQLKRFAGDTYQQLLSCEE